MRAYEAFVSGLQFYGQRFKDANAQARAQFLRAVELDPAFARAFATLANTHLADFVNGWSNKPAASLQRADALAQHALALDDKIAQVHFVMALVRREQKRHTEAMSHAAQAITFNPNYADAFVLLASELCYNGQTENTLALIEKAKRLNPLYPANYSFHSGVCQFTLGNYAAAAREFESALARNPASQRSSLWLSASYAHSGRENEARGKISELLTRNPALSLKHVADSVPYQRPEDMQRLFAGLRQAGMPD